jgi:hypothetical protein
MGLEIDLATIDMKKEIEIDFNAREIKIEILATFEIKVVPITFVIKNEIKKLEEMEIMQEKPNLTNIPKLVQEYIIKYSNYLYY